MALPLLQEEPDQEFWNNRAADFMPTSTWDRISSEFELSQRSTAISSIADMYNISQREALGNQRELSVEELNQKYGGAGITWTEPKKERVADYIYQKHQEKRILESRISRGPEGFGVGAMGFGAGIAAHLLDPVELGVNIAGGWALRGLGAVGVRGFSYFAQRGLAPAIARGVTEGVVTGVPFEGLNIVRDRQLQMDVSASDSITNIAFGGIAGGAIEGLGYGIGRALSKRMPGVPEHLLTEKAAAQVEMGRMPTLKPFEAVFDRERLGLGRPGPGTPDFSGRANYAFKAMDTNVPVSGKFYLGAQSKLENFKELTHSEYKNARRDFGGGVYIVDDPYVANGYAASSFNEIKGIVHEVDLADAKLLDVSKPLPESVRAKMESKLKELDSPVGKPGESLTAEQIYRAIDDSPEAMGEFNKAIEEAGYDGVHFTDQADNGSGKHNGAMLFENRIDKLSQKGAYDADERYLAGLTQDEIDAHIRSYNDRTQELGYDPQTEKAVDDLTSRLEDQPIEAEENFKLARQELAELEAEGALTEAEIDELKLIDSEVSKGQKTGQSVIKGLYACIGRGA